MKGGRGAMKRNVTLEEISDGKLYTLNDMVKADCYDCKGCSACCHGMGDSIVLTPYDVFLLTTNLHCTFEELLQGKIELNVQDGIILPNLALNGEDEACAFLDKNGRCTIHSFRPGICRLFPLGRYYEEDGFKYILQVHECVNKNRGKIKVIKWLDTPDIRKNEAFIFRWHTLITNLGEYISETEDPEMARKLNMQFLKIFYLTPYEDPSVNALAGDFYEQIEKRFAMLNA